MRSSKKRHNWNLALVGTLLAALSAGACGDENPPGGDGDSSPGGAGAEGSGDGDGDETGGTGGDGDGDETGGTGGDGDGDGDETGGTGGDGDGDGDATPLKLLSQYPSPDDNNASALSPIRLVFSETVDPSTIEEAISVRSGGKKLSFSSKADGSAVVLSLDEIPSLPTRISVVVTSDLMSQGGGAFSGDSFSFTYPLWHAAGALPASDTEVVLCSRDGALLLATTDESGILVREYEDQNWRDLPRPVSNPARPIEIIPGKDGPILIYLVENEVRAATLEQDDQWSLLDDALTTNLDSKVVAGETPKGAVVVAWATGPNLQIAELTEQGWQVASARDAGEDVVELSATGDDQGLVIAAVGVSGDIQVVRFDGDAWTTVGSPIDRERTGEAMPSLKYGDSLYLSYLDGDEVSNNVQVKSFDGSWQPVGTALDLITDGEAALPTMAIAEDGTPVVAWLERDVGPRRLLVARKKGERFQILGTAPASDVPDDATQVELMVDQSDFPAVALATDNALSVHRFNGSPTLPRGLENMGDIGDCFLPEDGDDFPQTLAETGCYVDVEAGQLVGGAIPFNINSLLWSDGADKRRFVVLPEGRTVEFKETGALGFPTGTILIKEFLIERITGDPKTLIPMETRFLIKRCDLEESDCNPAWQGYSYIWNDTGSGATLLPGETTKLWDVTTNGAPAQHEHVYPSRSQCAECHRDIAGGTNGLQAPQLNRPQIYGEVIDNQLRAWISAGVFGDTAPSVAPEELSVVTSPADVGRSLQERSAGYFHANCAHCHQPAGLRPIPDLRYFGPGLDALTCADATSAKQPGKYVLPGDHENSVMYIRDAARDGASGLQMPPIATLLVDERQLSVTARWIDSLSPTSCED